MTPRHQHLALFDLDGTLLPDDSDHAFGDFLVRLGWADAGTFRQRNDDFYRDYLAGTLDIARYIDFATSAWRHRSAPELAQARQRFMREVIEPLMHDSAQALVQRHRERGDRLAIVTATNEFVTAPIAEAFGIDTLIATELERDAAGRVTGAIRGVPCFQEGKIVRVTQWLQALGTSLDACESVTFYSDSINDLPLMETVSHPVATNPGPSLQAEALKRGWPILNLFA